MPPRSRMGPSLRDLVKNGKNPMTRYLPGIAAMALIVVASNILVQFVIEDWFLTWGAFTYPAGVSRHRRDEQGLRT